MLRKVIYLLLFFNVFSLHADEFTELACERVFNTDISGLENQRSEDKNFIKIDFFCCCNDTILEIFKDRTEAENEEVNPATDIMLQSIGELEKIIRLTIKEVENLKQINAMYSFTQVAMMTPPTDPSTPDLTGECIAVDITDPDDLAIYAQVVDKMETGGSGSYTIENGTTGAWGRYQFIPSTARSYCQKVPPSLGLNCCTNWKNSPECQDEMFRIFTEDNVGWVNMPITTCSLYIAHQQGAGGAGWIYGGRPPRGYINPDGTATSIAKDAVRLNAPSTWKEAIANGEDINSIDVLRDIYIRHWNKRFGADILEGGSSSFALGDFVDATIVAEEYLYMQKSLWREGILLEIKKVLHSMERLRKKRGR